MSVRTGNEKGRQMKMLRRKTIAIIAAAITAAAAAGCSSDESIKPKGVGVNNTAPSATTTTVTSAPALKTTTTTVTTQAPKKVYDVSLSRMMDFFYTGQPLCPKVLVVDEDGEQLGEDEYTVSYKNNTDIGTASAEVTVNEDGVKYSLEFEICCAPLDSGHANISLSQETFDYTGKEQKAAVELTNTAGTVLSEGTDYVLEYSDAVGPGTVTVTAKGIGNYTGSISTEYVINPPKAGGVRFVTSGERTVTLAWDKCAGVQGYQVCLRKSNGEYFVLADINTGACTAEIGGLEPETTYTFYVRPYLNSNGTTLYGGSDGFKASTKTGSPDRVIITDAVQTDNGIMLKWSAEKRAEWYIVQKHNGSEWVQVGAMKGTTFIDKDASENGTYRYRVKAERKAEGKTLSGEFSEERAVTVEKTAKSADPENEKPTSSSTLTEKTEVRAYYFTANETVTDLKGNTAGTLKANSIYSGYQDPAYPGKIVIDFMYSTCLVSDVHAVVKQNSKMLGTAAVGQMGGKIWGQASCGPTAVAILATWQAGTPWNKDELILYAEKNSLNDQGSLRKAGGMTAPMMLKLISGYSGGKLTALNIYGTGSTADVLKAQIDKGNRSIIVCQYTSKVVTHYNSGTHFVVVCGYEYSDGELYFYYADPYYSNGGRSLLMVKASTLAASMDMVKREPRCIIVLNK